LWSIEHQGLDLEHFRLEDILEAVFLIRDLVDHLFVKVLRSAVDDIPQADIDVHPDAAVQFIIPCCPHLGNFVKQGLLFLLL
jgi:hypothetical protein